MFVFVDCLTNWREVFATPDYNHLLLWSGYRWKKFVSHHGVPSKVLEDEDRGKAFLSSVRVNKGGGEGGGDFLSELSPSMCVCVCVCVCV